MQIYKELRFEAAHFLPQVPEGHKCRRMHGHSYRVEVHVRGPVDPARGWVQDYGDIRACYAPLLDELDHRLLNEIPGLENPTSEILARWIWGRLAPQLPGLARIVVHETCTTGCIYEGEDEGR